MLKRLAALLAAGLFAAPAGLAAAAPLVLDVDDATVVLDQTLREPVLSLTLTSASGEAFAAFTAAEVGHEVTLRIDGEVVMTPHVMEPITGGLLWISGDFEEGELAALASRIVAGDAVVEVEGSAE